MPAASSTESPTTRVTVSPLALIGGIVTAALVALGAYAGHDTTAYAVLAASLAFAWGWPVLLDLPRPNGSSIVLAAASVGMAGVVVFSGDTDGMQAVSVVLAIGLVLAFLHELVRTDGRAHLTRSLAGAALGLAVLGSGIFAAGAASYPEGDAATAIVMGAAALGLIGDLILPARHAREWSLPAGLLLGVVLALLVGLTAGSGLGYLLLAGLAAGLVAFAIRRALGAVDPIDPAAQLAYGIGSVLITGVLAYAAQWLINY